LIKVEEISKTADYPSLIKEKKDEYSRRCKELRKEINSYFVKLPPGKYEARSSNYNRISIRKLDFIDYVYVKVDLEPLDKCDLTKLTSLAGNKELIVKKIYDEWEQKCNVQ